MSDATYVADVFSEQGKDDGFEQQVLWSRSFWKIGFSIGLVKGLVKLRESRERGKAKVQLYPVKWIAGLLLGKHVFQPYLLSLHYVLMEDVCLNILFFVLFACGRTGQRCD